MKKHFLLISVLKKYLRGDQNLNYKCKDENKKFSSYTKVAMIQRVKIKWLNTDNENVK